MGGTDDPAPPPWSWRRRIARGGVACVILAALACAGGPPRQPAARADPGASTTYYVAATGEDAAPCAREAPCASFLRATSLTAPGDTVVVESGSYGPQVITANGTAAAPITVTARGAVTLTRPLPLTDASQITSLLQIIGSSYVTVNGFTVIGAKGQPGYNPVIQPYGGEVVAFNPSAGNPGARLVFSNLTILHANNTCVKTQDHEPDTQVLNSTLVDCGSTYVGYTNAFNIVHTPNLDHGIYASGPGLYAYNNTVISATGSGITTGNTDARNDISRASVISNVVTGTISNTGIALQEAPVTITNNVVVDTALGGISLYDWDPNHTGEPNLIANNVVVGCAHPVAGANYGGFGFADPGHGYALPAPEDTIKLVNNTFYDNGAFPLIHMAGIGAVANERLVVENNIIDAPGDGSALGQFIPYTGTVFDHNDYAGVTPRLYLGAAGFDSTIDGGHSLATDPLFVDQNARPLPDLHLRGASPAIGAGADVGLPYDGSSPDLGALPYASAPVPTPTVVMPGGPAPTATASPVPSKTPHPAATAPSPPSNTPVSTATSPATATGAPIPAETPRSSATRTPPPTDPPTSPPPTIAAPATRAAVPTATVTATAWPAPTAPAAPATPSAVWQAPPGPPAARHHRRPRETSMPPPALTVSLTTRRVAGGAMVRVSVRTTPRARLRVTLQMLTPRVVATDRGRRRARAESVPPRYRATFQGTVDARGWFAGRMRITYRLVGATPALLTVMARTPSGVVARTIRMTLRPR